MLRIAVPVALVAMTGCAHPQTMQTLPRRSETVPLAPITLDYRITREGPEGPVIVAGQTAIDSSRPILIEHRLPRGTSATRLRFEAQPLPDGKVLVGMSYDEESHETGTIHWTPRVVLAHGGESVLRNAWGTSGEGRTVRLSVR